MKRFTVLLTTLSVLAVWSIFQATAAKSEAKNASALPKVYDATGAMLEAINSKDAEVKIVPVYDATGTMLDAINPNKKVVTLPAYDATGAMLDAINPNQKVVTLPAYDATSTMLDAINP